MSLPIDHVESSQNTESNESRRTIVNPPPIITIPVRNSRYVTQVGSPVVNAVPIPPETHITISISDDMLLAVSLSKTIKWLTLFDGIISFIYSIYNMWFLIPLIISITGYYGAKNFSKRYVNVYLVYTLVNSFTRFAVYLYL